MKINQIESQKIKEKLTERARKYMQENISKEAVDFGHGSQIALGIQEKKNWIQVFVI